MELQGAECSTGGRDGRPSPLALSGGLPDDDVLLLGPAVDAPVDPPLERTPIRSPSRFGGTLRPLAAGHSSQVWPLVSGSLLLLAIAIVLVLALAVADAGALGDHVARCCFPEELAVLQLFMLAVATVQDVPHQTLVAAQAAAVAHGAQEHVPKFQVLSLSREEVHNLPHTIS